jgi:hypothetical protein
VIIIVHQVLTATNISGTTTQNDVVVQVRDPLRIASPASTVFGIGVSNSFTVQTTGAPQKITVDGSRPANVTFTDNGNGTATFAGTPPSGARGTYTLTLTATADDTSTTQSFTWRSSPRSPRSARRRPGSASTTATTSGSASTCWPRCS